MRVVVDTNVALVANKEAPQATTMCIDACADILRKIQLQHIVVIDDDWRILKEYLKKLDFKGQTKAGDLFLRWLLTNHSNPERCEQVKITPLASGVSFAEFPSDPQLKGFDRSDRKFVAVALAHSEHPPILNAVDSDWWHYRTVLERHGVRIEFLCPDAEPKQRE